MIPSSVKTVLWSYDISKMDVEKHKNTIVAQVLNLGTTEAVEWLFKTYKREDISQIASVIPKTAWNSKSLALWSLILGINPPARRVLR